MLVFQLELGMFFEAKQSSSPAVFWLMWSTWTGILLDETELKVLFYESSLCMLLTCGCSMVCFEVEMVEMPRWWMLILNGNCLALQIFFCWSILLVDVVVQTVRFYSATSLDPHISCPLLINKPIHKDWRLPTPPFPIKKKELDSSVTL